VVVVEVETNSVAEANNIYRGDIIIEMGRKIIKNVSDYKLELDAYEKSDTVMLRILRNNNPFYIAFEIE
jgi:S1-C subfamily serine protease